MTTEEQAVVAAAEADTSAGSITTGAVVIW
jgi:hypothetical protein